MLNSSVSQCANLRCDRPDGRLGVPGDRRGDQYWNRNIACDTCFPILARLGVDANTIWMENDKRRFAKNQRERIADRRRLGTQELPELVSQQPGGSIGSQSAATTVLQPSAFLGLLPNAPSTGSQPSASTGFQPGAPIGPQQPSASIDRQPSTLTGPLPPIQHAGQWEANRPSVPWYTYGGLERYSQSNQSNQDPQQAVPVGNVIDSGYSSGRGGWGGSRGGGGASNQTQQAAPAGRGSSTSNQTQGAPGGRGAGQQTAPAGRGNGNGNDNGRGGRGGFPGGRGGRGGT